MSHHDNKPKLLYAVDPPLSTSGGVSILVSILIKYFSDHYQIYLLSADSTSALESSGMNRFIRGHLRWNPPKKPPRLDFLRYTKQIADEIAGIGIDLVHFQTSFYSFGNRFYGFSVARQLRNKGIPCLWTNHAVVAPLNGYGPTTQALPIKLLLFPLAWLGKFDQIKHTELEIQVSQFNLRAVSRIWFPFKRKFRKIQHSRIEASALEAIPRKQTILNVGYISFNKRQDLLIQAFLQLSAIHPLWEICFAGHDTNDGCRDYIIELIKNSPLEKRVHFLGECLDIDNLMQSCGMFVHCSDIESFGLATQEAMYHGCPIIASDIPAHKELLAQSKSGILFRHGNVEDLKVKIDMLISNPDIRNLIGNAAKHSANSSGMTSSAMINNHTLLYSDILNRN